MPMSDGSRTRGFQHHPVWSIGEVSADRRRTHRAAVPTGALPVENAPGRGFPWSPFTDGAQDAMRGASVTAPWILGILAGERSGQRVLLDLPVFFQATHNRQ